MKNLIILFLAITFNLPTGQAGFELQTLNCFAQPNAGFENWSTVFGMVEPDNWQTWNFVSLTNPPNPLSAFKATGVDKHSGNYALKIKTIYLNHNPNPGVFPDSIGVTFTGKINYNPISVKYGYPYTGRPEKLQFWAKYQPVDNDVAAAGVYLRKWNGVSADTIAYGVLTIGPTSQYTLFQLTLTYLSPGLPDSAAIGFISSKNNSTIRVGSTLFVDDVSFTGWVGIDESGISQENKVQLFPNPAKDNVNISTTIEDADNVLLLDISGKLVYEGKLFDHKTTINTFMLPVGIYFCEVRDKKNRILTKNKFNVVK